MGVCILMIFINTFFAQLLKYHRLSRIRKAISVPTQTINTHQLREPRGQLAVGTLALSDRGSVPNPQLATGPEIADIYQYKFYSHYLNSKHLYIFPAARTMFSP